MKSKGAFRAWIDHMQLVATLSGLTLQQVADMMDAIGEAQKLIEAEKSENRFTFPFIKGVQ